MTLDRLRREIEALPGKTITGAPADYLGGGSLIKRAAVLSLLDSAERAQSGELDVLLGKALDAYWLKRYGVLSSAEIERNHENAIELAREYVALRSASTPRHAEELCASCGIHEDTHYHLDHDFARVYAASTPQEPK